MVWVVTEVVRVGVQVFWLLRLKTSGEAWVERGRRRSRLDES